MFSPRPLRLSLLLGLLLCLGAASPGHTAPAPDGADIDVTYISREPRYEWTAQKVWPAPGETVTFTAHLVNKGRRASGPFGYTWRIDDQLAGSGQVADLAPGASAAATLSWPWAAGGHTVSFQADPANQVIEAAENNNQRADPTDALSVGFWVEQSVYERFNSEPNATGTASWEDWAQDIVARMNRAFALSRHPGAPDGVLTRVRLDKVTVVPDGTLFSLNWQHAPIEAETDVQWGFSLEEYGPAVCPESCRLAPWWVIHELGHYLLGRVDLYGLDVQGVDVEVLDDAGRPVAGTPPLPLVQFDVLRYASRNYDLMHASDINGLYSDYHVYSLNRDWPPGSRAHEGWRYIHALPAESVLRVLDNDGRPIAGAQVAVYHAAPGNGQSGPYSQLFDNTPEISATTDAQGQVSLGANPFGALEQHGVGMGVSLVRLRPPGGAARYVWLEVIDFNMAVWRGETRYVHDVTFPSGPLQLRLSQAELAFAAREGGAAPAPQQVQVRVPGDGVRYWRAGAPSAAWLRTIPDDTRLPAPPGPLTVIVDPSGLAPGSYAATVPILAEGALGSPATLTVRLTVAAGEATATSTPTSTATATPTRTPTRTPEAFVDDLPIHVAAPLVTRP